MLIYFNAFEISFPTAVKRFFTLLSQVGIGMSIFSNKVSIIVVLFIFLKALIVIGMLELAVALFIIFFYLIFLKHILLVID